MWIPIHCIDIGGLYRRLSPCALSFLSWGSRSSGILETCNERRFTFNLYFCGDTAAGCSLVWAARTRYPWHALSRCIGCTLLFWTVTHWFRGWLQRADNQCFGYSSRCHRLAKDSPLTSNVALPSINYICIRTCDTFALMCIWHLTSFYCTSRGVLCWCQWSHTELSACAECSTRVRDICAVSEPSDWWRRKDSKGSTNVASHPIGSRQRQCTRFWFRNRYRYLQLVPASSCMSLRNDNFVLLITI